MGYRRGRISALALVIASLACVADTAAQGEPGAEIRGDALRVFLDCNTFPCDSEYFRTDVTFVNWVRDRTLAQVHLIITSNQTGGGGNQYSLDFIGLRELDGADDQLTFTSLGIDTEDEILSSLSQVIGAGFARYSTLIGQPAAFEISAAERPEAETERLVGAAQVEDPWNFWVFEVGADVDLEGEETERQREYGASFEARRTTETWKLEFEWDAEFRWDERELEDGSLIVDDRTEWSADVLLAYALADRWSLGAISGAGASTRRNQDFGADVAAALEYSFFPYVDAPRQSLTARYELRLQYFDWEEETVFFETEELRPQHQLRLQLFQRQPWGESGVSIAGRQYLHDLGKWSVSLSGDLEFRIIRGLELEVEVDLELIEDQLFISRERLTDEDILLGRFERPTDMTYGISVGLNFEFGSIFNNVVNNRFDSRGRRGFGR